MRGVVAGVVLALCVLAAGCGGGKPDDVVLHLNTPQPSPTSINDGPGNSIPLPELVLSTEDVFQGGAILASVTGDITAGNITFLGRDFQLTQGARSLYTFLPVDTADPPGETTMVINFTLSNGTQGSMNQAVTVLETDWTVDSLTFTAEQISSLLDPYVSSSEVELLRAVYSGYTPEKLWTEGWQVPADAYITARFGEQRSINGEPASGHHGGTDLGAALDTPVRAANSGRVVLSRQLTVRGNVVVIDHGGGLFSGYAHMTSFAVAEGQVVAKGDTIGYVGSTGLSTAPHLHWEMAQNGVLLDAWRFVDGSNGF